MSKLTKKNKKQIKDGSLKNKYHEKSTLKRKKYYD